MKNIVSSLARLSAATSSSLTNTDEKALLLPEKVLQFGTGVLLRGLPDFFINKANQQGLFNGRVVVVKSTDAGSTDAFQEQDGLYTICQRGLEKGEALEEFVVSSAISRVLSAKGQWAEILACARNPSLQIIISNTTEVGIQLTDDQVNATPPQSFPGKLTAFLYERFLAFGGSADSGMVVIPCELLVDNGKKLKDIVLALAQQNGLETAFIDWLQTHNHFCSSLVDRIVTGMPEPAAAQEIYEKLGYQDDLLTVSEIYRLWAIEGDARVKEILSFEQADEGVLILPDIQPYRERKLRLLNGTHTLMVSLGFLSGLDTVGDCMKDAAMSRFVSDLMEKEIIPSVPIDRAIAESFAHEVKDRFSNPYIVHPLLSISVQCTSKMQMRNMQTLLNYYNKFQTIPPNLTLGFAAYLLFMKATKEENGKYFGERKGISYPIQDASAAYFYEKWQSLAIGYNHSIPALVEAITSEVNIWGTDLNTVPGFTNAVSAHLEQMLEGNLQLSA
ncbi:MAG: tagaturonate reductase [Bacteroidota bacterium]